MSHSKKKKGNGKAKTLEEAQKIFSEYRIKNRKLFAGCKIGNPYTKHDKVFFPTCEDGKVVSRTIVFPSGYTQTFNV